MRDRDQPGFSAKAPSGLTLPTSRRHGRLGQPAGKAKSPPCERRGLRLSLQLQQEQSSEAFLLLLCKAGARRQINDLDIRFARSRSFRREPVSFRKLSCYV